LDTPVLFFTSLGGVDDSREEGKRDNSVRTAGKGGACGSKRGGAGVQLIWGGGGGAKGGQGKNQCCRDGGRNTISGEKKKKNGTREAKSGDRPLGLEGEREGAE